MEVVVQTRRTRRARHHQTVQNPSVEVEWLHERSSERGHGCIVVKLDDPHLGKGIIVAMHLRDAVCAHAQRALELPFLLVGLRRLGRGFVAKAAWGMVVFSVGTRLFEPLAQATADTLLACTFGGVLLGIGVGLVLRSGGCLDGTEIVGILINRRSGVSIGTVVLSINVPVYAVAGVLFGPDRGMYSLIMYFIGARVIDMVEMGGTSTKSALIVADDGTMIAELIYRRLGRTVTYLRGVGYVSAEPKDVPM